MAELKIKQLMRRGDKLKIVFMTGSVLECWVDRNIRTKSLVPLSWRPAIIFVKLKQNKTKKCIQTWKLTRYNEFLFYTHKR